jgi:pseudaminic acid cytidylyltransferase
MKPIAIIPARGGSKRLKNKNIKSFLGKSILQRTIEKIQNTKIFSKIVLSSDSKKIINLAKKYKVDFIVNRNGYLASNKATTLEVVQDAIKKIDYKNFKYVCCIYPCNPLLFKSDLRNIFSKIKKDNNKFIFPVCEYSHPIERAFTLNRKKEISFLNKKNANLNTQSFKKNIMTLGSFIGVQESVG